MENNPKKSKALIITIVAILVLVVAVYLIFKNSDKLFGTKGGAISKIFSPLLGSSKQKNVDTITKPETSTDQTDTDIPDTGDSNTGGDRITTPTPIAPPFTPLPTPSSRNYLAPDITPDPIIASAPQIVKSPEPTPPICLNTNDYPLEYTDVEKDELVELLRQYYLIAPELKTASEVVLLNEDIKKNQALIDSADILTGQCKEQKVDPKYAGPKAVKNNPYYSDLNTTPEFFAPTIYNDIETLLNIW